MSSLDVPVRNLAIEWRYEHSLAIYSSMDQVGIAFKDSYPDWQRTALTLELRDKKHRRRFYMSFNRCFFHTANPDDATIELDKAVPLFDLLAQKMDIKTVKRIGLRQWSAFPRQESLKELVQLTARRFQPTSEKLLDLLQGTVEDVSYVTEATHVSGWKYNLRLGPMEKKQWFEIVEFEGGAFEPKAAEEFKESFPEVFLYIDMDASKEDVPYSETKILLQSMREGSHKVMRGLHDYLKES